MTTEVDAREIDQRDTDDEELRSPYVDEDELDPRPAAAPRDRRPTLDELRAPIRRLQSALADTGIGLLVIRRDTAFMGYCGLVQGRATLDEPELDPDTANAVSFWMVETALLSLDTTEETAEDNELASTETDNVVDPLPARGTDPLGIALVNVLVLLLIGTPLTLRVAFCAAPPSTMVLALPLAA